MTDWEVHPRQSLVELSAEERDRIVGLGVAFVEQLGDEVVDEILLVAGDSVAVMRSTIVVLNNYCELGRRLSVLVSASSDVVEPRPPAKRASSSSRMLRPGARALSPVIRQPSLLLYSSGGSFNRPAPTSTTRAKNSSWSIIGLTSNVVHRSQAMQLRHDRQLRARDRFEVLVGDVAELAAGVREVLADVDLVTGEDADRELAAGGDQRVGVVLRRHAGHHDRLLEADLAHPVAAVRAGSRRRDGRRRPGRPSSSDRGCA